MFARWRAWRRAPRLRGLALHPGAWEEVRGLPLFQGLDEDELRRLHDLAALFLDEKPLQSVGEPEISPRLSVLIAAQACLPILNLGLDCYRDCSRLVLYPAGFIARHRYTDEAGLEHDARRPLIGESWERGPVVLSLEDVEDSLALDGFNVVIHEFAHQLDMQNGEPNGYPPLHRDMDAGRWSRVWSQAFKDFSARVERGEETAIDPYAADSPAEFLAVLSEAFFELPGRLRGEYPEVYAELAAYYRQDPAARLAPGGATPIG